MNRYPRGLAIFLAILLLASLKPLTAQVEIDVKTQAEGDKVRITYNIKDSLSSRLYSVKLVARSAESIFLLKNIEGEYGKNISVGEHEVVWDALAQLERFSGNLVIEIQAFPQFMFLGPKADQAVKRGEPISFSWYGNNSTLDSLRVELYRYDELLDTLGTINSQGTYTWQVPGDIKASGGYRIRIIGTSKSGNLTAFSPQVKVVERVPVLYKFVGLGTAVTGLGIIVIQLLRALPPIFLPDR